VFKDPPPDRHDEMIENAASHPMLEVKHSNSHAGLATIERLIVSDRSV